MATLVLTTIGGAIGGPIGAMLGGLLGQSVDRELFKPKGRFGSVAGAALSSAYVVLICAIVWIVLAKPNIDSNQFAKHLFEPGALSQLLR